MSVTPTIANFLIANVKAVIIVYSVFAGIMVKVGLNYCNSFKNTVPLFEYSTIIWFSG